ncbi:electron transfer flavoprotein subunit beta [Photobacterium sp. SDRW27]|uniref:electron transfer flavoprotein subunit beta n=1 Tax=Photobacterium obscurum TaxID=2829490 RepID=UPI00224464B6|nr:electron transfer flavoprotein subunit beta [Photobacterium obscurum]MCW8328460.1 electron transfer flavoprotein subunit beta [Photobacterium obscurum]
MMLCEPLQIMVLVSTGMHSLTGRPCRASLDAQAIELALQQSGAVNEVVHAGHADESEQSALRDYLGMGIGQITVLKLPELFDPVSALAQYVNEAEPDLVLCGEQAEWGEASGLLPYLLADQLGWAIVPHIAGLAGVADGHIELLQALPRGQRRKIQVKQPAVVTINGAAPQARQSAFSKARDGIIKVLESELKSEFEPAADSELSQWQLQPAKPRPKRLKSITANTAAERMKAAITVTQSQAGKVLQDSSPQQAAEAILALLREEGILK